MNTEARVGTGSAGRLICHEDKPERLLAGMNLLGLDVVLSDAPVPPGSKVRAFSHLPGSCGVTFFASARLAAKASSNFPYSLAGVPLLLPFEGTAMRRALDAWFHKLGIRPSIAGEFYDSALMKVFGEDGAGVFAAPQPIEGEIKRMYRVIPIGITEDVRERFYAISAERKFKHPAVVGICDAARHDIFSMNAA